MEWFYKHYVITSIVLLVFVGLFAAVTLKVFFDPINIPSGTVAGYGTFFTIGGLIITVLKLGAKRADKSGE